MKVLDICSGIGGFTLGHMISGGFETAAFCEINQYCQQVLSLRFPEIPIISDIHDITNESISRLGVGAIAGIIGGPPCQPFSAAGQQLASKDDRNLWPEVARIIRCIRPQWVCLENVPNLLTVESGDYFRQILWEFSQMGFDVEWGVLSAASVGAVHLRERVWIIATAHTKSIRKNGENLLDANSIGDEREARHESRELGDVANPQGSRRYSSWRNISQKRTNPTPVSSCNDANSNGQRQSDKQGAIAQFERCSSDAGNPTGTGLEGEQWEGFHGAGRQPEFTNSVECRAIAQPTISRSDDGLPAGLDGCLLTHSGLTSWLTAATVPSFTRLSAKEARSLAAEDQAEYRQLWKEYQLIRRQHKEQIAALGNAISPQCAAKIFNRLKIILGE